MDKLFALLELQHQAQKARSRDALIHTIVNETLKIIPYTQAVFFAPDAISVKLERASGNAVLDAHGIYASTLKKHIKSAMQNGGQDLIILSPQAHQTHGALLRFENDEEGFLGGVWLENGAAYNDAEKRILEELCIIYTQCLALWELRKSAPFFPSFKTRGKWKWPMIAAGIVITFFPVRMSITAPAEVIAKKAQIITAPFDGLIEAVEIEPGDTVKAGDLLASMENKSLEAQMDMAEQEILVAESALSRMQRESLATPEKKANLVELKEEIESKRIARDYAMNMKERSEIKAPADGIAVFSGSHSLKGKPVHTGEKIMTIADPQNYELLIRAPIDSMIKIPENAQASFFLNISPLKKHFANLRSVGYQASADADGLMTYKIIATLPVDKKDMRIGWKGVAHIKGDWTILSYAILRRPIISLRNLMGI